MREEAASGEKDEEDQGRSSLGDRDGIFLVRWFRTAPTGNQGPGIDTEGEDDTEAGTAMIRQYHEIWAWEASLSSRQVLVHGVQMHAYEVGG